MTFNESRQISGSEHWQGTQYTVFRSYRPQWHDQNWYHSRYNRIVLIAGGYYFFNAGYWYPAWGYQPTAQYYAYDGPIYAGSVPGPDASYRRASRWRWVTIKAKWMALGPLREAHIGSQVITASTRPPRSTSRRSIHRNLSGTN